MQGCFSSAIVQEHGYSFFYEMTMLFPKHEFSISKKIKLVLEDDKLPITITLYIASSFLAGENDTVATSCVLQDKFGCIIYFNICKYENRYFIYFDFCKDENKTLHVSMFENMNI